MLLSLAQFTVLLRLAVATSSYAPMEVTCPATLIRVAPGLVDDEEAYRTTRKSKSDVALRSWLESTSSSFNTTGKLPTLGITNSGGHTLIIVRLRLNYLEFGERPILGLSGVNMGNWTTYFGSIPGCVAKVDKASLVSGPRMAGKKRDFLT